jgi:CrcB protein
MAALLCRSRMDGIARPGTGGRVPVGNIVGSMAMGLLVGWLARSASGSEGTRLLLAVGLLGGFTTFSSFSLEVVSLIQRAQPGLAALYMAITLGAGLIGLWLGLYMMRAAV